MKAGVMTDVLPEDFSVKIKVAFFGFGAVVSSTGQVLYGVRELSNYWRLGHDAAQAFMWVSSLTTLYVRVKTRFPALYKQFSKKPNAAASQKLTRNQKFLLFIVGLSGFVSGLANAGQSYLGGTSVLQLVSLGGKVSDPIVGAYCGLASLGSYYAFFVQNSIDNARALTQVESVGSKCKVAKDVLITTLITGLGASALGMFSYFAFNGFLQVLPDNTYEKTPPSVLELLSFLALISTVITTLLSRIAETYKYFSIEKSLDIGTLPAKKLVLLLPATVFGPLDIVAFSASLYIACINIAEKYRLHPDSTGTQTLAGLAALSGGFIHWVFSVRRIIKAEIANLKETQGLQEPLLSR